LGQPLVRRDYLLAFGILPGERLVLLTDGGKDLLDLSVAQGELFLELLDVLFLGEDKRDSSASTVADPPTNASPRAAADSVNATPKLRHLASKKTPKYRARDPRVKLMEAPPPLCALTKGLLSLLQQCYALPVHQSKTLRL
jgi:hypothetical protein